MKYEINPLQYFLKRELSFVPKHFVAAKTVLTNDSYHWILSNLSGRFAIETKASDSSDELVLSFMTTNTVPAFEDPQEAVLYELRWS